MPSDHYLAVHIRVPSGNGAAVLWRVVWRVWFRETGGHANVCVNNFFRDRRRRRRRRRPRRGGRGSVRNGRGVYCCGLEGDSDSDSDSVNDEERRAEGDSSPDGEIVEWYRPRSPEAQAPADPPPVTFVPRDVDGWVLANAAVEEDDYSFECEYEEDYLCGGRVGSTSKFFDVSGAAVASQPAEEPPHPGTGEDDDGGRGEEDGDGEEEGDGRERCTICDFLRDDLMPAIGTLECAALRDVPRGLEETSIFSPPDVSGWTTPTERRTKYESCLRTLLTPVLGRDVASVVAQFSSPPTLRVRVHYVYDPN